MPTQPNKLSQDHSLILQRKNLVPEYIRQLKPYQSGKPIEELAREKGLTRITKLASNENPLGPSPLAIREMTKSLWDVHRYPDMHGHELKSALGQLYGLKHENIILGSGSEGIMGYIARAFLAPDQEVLTSQGTFIGFLILARSVGAKIIEVPMTNDHRYHVQNLISAITPQTKVVYIANPNNPTGTFLTRSEFDLLMENIPGHVLVILDEAYFEFAKDHPDFPDSMTYRYDNVITLRTFSKAYGISGIRVGYGFGHADLIANLTKIKLPFEPNLIGQKGAVGALQDRVHLHETLENNRKELQRLEHFLKNEGVAFAPSVTNFVMTYAGEHTAAINNIFLNSGVILRPLIANEMPQFLRISIGTPEEMNHFYEVFASNRQQLLSLWTNLKKSHKA